MKLKKEQTKDYTVTKKCPKCGKTNSVVLTPTEMRHYHGWEYRIDDKTMEEAMPYKTDKERAFLEFGICSDCYNA